MASPPEEVAVVEGAEALDGALLPGGDGQIAHLGLGETEGRRELRAEDAVDLHVVEAGEEALLGDAQDAGEHALPEILVVLEAPREEVAEEGDDIVVIPVGVARRGWGSRTFVDGEG